LLFFERVWFVSSRARGFENHIFTAVPSPRKPIILSR
jgi:hypothetical protein